MGIRTALTYMPSPSRAVRESPRPRPVGPPCTVSPAWRWAATGTAGSSAHCWARSVSSASTRRPAQSRRPATIIAVGCEYSVDTQRLL